MITTEVLLVAGSEVTRAGLKAVLESEGDIQGADEARSGQEALGEARALACDGAGVEELTERERQSWDPASDLDFQEVGSGPNQLKYIDFDEKGWPANAGGATVPDFETDLSYFLTRVKTYFNSDWEWNTSCSFGQRPYPPYRYYADFRVVATHEFGHWMMLMDVCGGGSSVMCYGDAQAGCLTSPTSDDSTQARKIYGYD